jgi:hypothetical protein
VSLSVVEVSRPEGLGVSATQIVGKLAQLDQVIAAQQHGVVRLRTAWHEPGATTALDQAARDLARQQQFRGRLARVQSALAAGGVRLSSIRSVVIAIVGCAHVDGR